VAAVNSVTKHDRRMEQRTKLFFRGEYRSKYYKPENYPGSEDVGFRNNFSVTFSDMYRMKRHRTSFGGNKN
jgi:hypothetical protein